MPSKGFEEALNRVMQVTNPQKGECVTVIPLVTCKLCTKDLYTREEVLEHIQDHANKLALTYKEPEAPIG